MIRFSSAGRRSGATSLALAVCFTVPLLFTAIGCGGGSGSVTSGDSGSVVNGQGRATFAVRWPERDGRLVPLLANSIIVAVRNNEGKLVGNAVINRQEGSGATLSSATTIDPLPTGDLKVTATAYPERDGAGIAQATATAPLAIRANSNTEIRLSLQSTIDHLEAAAIDENVGVAYSVQIAATARDIDNNIVLTAPGRRRFELLSDPKFARLDTATGVLTGNSIGTAQVKITDEESGKSITVSVRIVRSAAYRLTWINSLPDLPYIYPEAVNANGEVVGICNSVAAFSTGTAFYWKPSTDGSEGQMTTITSPSGFTSVHPYAINDRGQVVGTADTGGGNPRYRAFLWENGQMTLLPVPTPGENCEAFDINSAGEVLGTAIVILPSRAIVSRPCIWRNGTPNVVNPASLPLVSMLNAPAINDAGFFVGRYNETFVGPTYAALWSPDSTITRLIPPAGNLNVVAQDINTSGQVAGQYRVTSAGQTVQKGFLFGNGRFSDILPAPNSGHSNISVLGITTDGTVAGYSYPAGPFIPPVNIAADLHAIRWRYGVTEELSKLLPANTPIPFSLQRGTAASGPGHIAGTGFRGETPQGFLLTPQGGTGGVNVGVN